MNCKAKNPYLLGTEKHFHLLINAEDYSTRVWGAYGVFKKPQERHAVGTEDLPQIPL